MHKHSLSKTDLFECSQLVPYNIDSDRVVFLYLRIGYDLLEGSCGGLSLVLGESAMEIAACDKPFTTYENQIILLQEKGLTIVDDAAAINTLKKVSYFALINGYKKIFKDKKTGQYRAGVRFEDIVHLYDFDTHLRSWLLRYVLIIERKLKSLVSYHFSERFKDIPRFYLEANNYRYDNSRPQVAKDVSELISKFNGILSSHKYRYVTHYNNRHDDIPLWVIICAMSFGKVSVLYDLCLPGVKKRICDEYNGMKSPDHMTNILKLLTKYRNVSAHNERLYDFIVHDQLSHMAIHKELNVPMSKGDYIYGRQDFYAVLIAFKCLLDDDEFSKCFSDIKQIIDGFRFDTNITRKADVLQEMHFPKNWERISELGKE